MRLPLTLLVLFFVGALVVLGVRHAGDTDRPLPPVDRPDPGPLATPDDLRGRDEPLIGRFPRSQFHIDHDRFLPATDPKTMPGTDVRFLENDDEVYGVLVGGHARAYPVRMISYYHVVNDRIDGVPIAVTY